MRIITKEDRVKVIAKLKELIECGGEPREGICEALRTVSYHGTRIVCELSMGWEHHSGYRACPVPYKGPALWSFICPARVFHTVENLWEGEYGDLRKDLCKYLISRLEEIAVQEWRFKSLYIPPCRVDHILV